MTQQHQVQQQQQQMQHQPRDVDTRLGVLESAVSDIRSVMQDISRDLKSRSSINWAPVNIMLAVCTIFGGMFFTWVNSNNGRMETAIAKVEVRSEAYVPRTDLDKRFEVISQRRDDLQRLTDARVERIERDTDTIAKQVVPRAEHDSYRQLQQRDYDLLRNRLDHVESRFEKRTDGLGRDIEKLEDRTLSRSEALSRNDAQDRITGAIRSEVDEHVRAFNERQQRRIDTLEAPLIRARP